MCSPVNVFIPPVQNMGGVNHPVGGNPNLLQYIIYYSRIIVDLVRPSTDVSHRALQGINKCPDGVHLKRNETETHDFSSIGLYVNFSLFSLLRSSRSDI